MLNLGLKCFVIRALFYYISNAVKMCTGCPDQIRPIFKITLLPNYKTYRKSKDSFRIVVKRATNNHLT